MTKWDFGDPAPTDLRAPRPDDELPPPHRRRRSTRWWCRGKVGVEHQLEIRVMRYVASQRCADPPDPLWCCGWAWWFWRRRHQVDDGWTYRCVHERFCTNCGKIYPLPKLECPEFDQHPRPAITAWEAEARAREARLARRRSKR